MKTSETNGAKPKQKHNQHKQISSQAYFKNKKKQTNNTAQKIIKNHKSFNDIHLSMQNNSSIIKNNDFLFEQSNEISSNNENKNSYKVKAQYIETSNNRKKNKSIRERLAFHHHSTKLQLAKLKAFNSEKINMHTRINSNKNLDNFLGKANSSEKKNVCKSFICNISINNNDFFELKNRGKTFNQSNGKDYIKYKEKEKNYMELRRPNNLFTTLKKNSSNKLFKEDEQIQNLCLNKLTFKCDQIKNDFNNNKNNKISNKKNKLSLSFNSSNDSCKNNYECDYMENTNEIYSNKKSKNNNISSPKFCINERANKINKENFSKIQSLSLGKVTDQDTDNRKRVANKDLSNPINKNSTWSEKNKKIQIDSFDYFSNMNNQIIKNNLSNINNDANSKSKKITNLSRPIVNNKICNNYNQFIILDTTMNSYFSNLYNSSPEKHLKKPNLNFFTNKTNKNSNDSLEGILNSHRSSSSQDGWAFDLNSNNNNADIIRI